MRLKEDSTNWNASNVKRKIAETPSVPIYKKKKDTRKWCKGRHGVKHDYQKQEKQLYANIIVTQDICVNCGKHDWRTHKIRHGKL